jgi:hypothetical protein
MLPMHTPLWQSAATPQTLPAAHLTQVPPQSMSVSVPFFTRSLHAGAWHVRGDPLHTPLWQSAATAHVLPAPHLPQLPPQSMSVSVPFFTLSVHVGA